MKTNFSGYVLAGGKSSRMKTDKAFLKFNGETFLERAVNALSPSCNERVKIIINENQRAKFEKSFAPLEFVFDIFPARGALGGIHAALKNSRSVWATILACDLPFVTKDAIKALAEIALNSPENIAAVVPEQPDGRIQPLCAVYKIKFCLPKIEELLEKEISVSMRDFLKLIPVRFVETNELMTGKTADLFFNINQPSDFQKLKSEAES
jgi:molybdopterin-guanine dinucleotide biosynthesis protein A